MKKDTKHNNTQKDWGKVREEMLMDDEDEILETPEEESAPSTASLSHPDYADLEQQLTLAEQKAHENWEKSVRAMAEVDNIRRRAERDIANAHRYGLEKFAEALLPVLDSLEQALQLSEQHGDESMHQGLELTMKLFVDVMEKQGIQQINPVGEMFNPQMHEAMAMQPAPEAQPNTVLAVVQKGYLLNDRVIRAARVIVAKN